MFLHSDRSLLQTVRVFFRIFQIVLKVFLFPIWSVLPSFSTSETSVLNLEKFVYEARIDGYEEYVEKESPVRLFDAFVESLDFKNLEFERETPRSEGRPEYNPRDLMRLYIYIYYYRLRSSRHKRNRQSNPKFAQRKSIQLQDAFFV